jgi:hypothetical protein
MAPCEDSGDPRRPSQPAPNLIPVSIEPMRFWRQDAEPPVGDVPAVQVGGRRRDAHVGVRRVALPPDSGVPQPLPALQASSWSARKTSTYRTLGRPIMSWAYPWARRMALDILSRTSAGARVRRELSHTYASLPAVPVARLHVVLQPHRVSQEGAVASPLGGRPSSSPPARRPAEPHGFLPSGHLVRGE